MLLDAFSHPSLLDLGNLVNRAHPLARGLTTWWLVIPQLSGGTRLRDLRGTLHGTLAGMAASPTVASGWHRTTSRPGGCGELALDGTDDVVDFPIAALDGYASGTISVWVKFDAVTFNSGAMTLVYAGDGGGEVLLFGTSFDNVGTDNIIFGIYTPPWDFVDSGSAPAVSRWYHYACTWGGAGRTIHTNGVLTGTNASTAGLGLGAAPLARFGGCYRGLNATVDGQMDDVRIYNRQLAAGEILALYVNSRQGYPGLLNRLPLLPRAPVVSFPGGDEGALWYHSIEAV